MVFQNDGFNMKKIHFILSTFLIMQFVDILLTNFGLSVYGLSYEKNLFMRDFISNYGFLSTSILKLASSFLIVLGILYLFDKSKNNRKYLIYFSVFLSLIPLYGIFSSLYILIL
jgi:uncharacterized membrane protein